MLYHKTSSPYNFLSIILKHIKITQFNTFNLFKTLKEAGNPSLLPLDVYRTGYFSYPREPPLPLGQTVKHIYKDLLNQLPPVLFSQILKITRSCKNFPKHHHTKFAIISHPKQHVNKFLKLSIPSS